MEGVKIAVIFIGLQASGKSSLYKERFTEDFAHVNMDTLKKRKREEELVESLISEGRSFVVDNTNPTREDRLRYIPKAKAAGYRIIGYYFKSAIRDCVRRNEARGGKVPSNAIAHTSNILKLPCYEEGFDEIYYVSMDESKRIFNISDWSEEK